MLARHFACLATLGMLAAPFVGAAQQRGQPAPSEAADPMGTIEGRVEIDEAGKRVPVRRALVTVTVDSGQSHTSETNVDGDFHFEQLPAGQYQIVADKAGLIPATADSPDAPPGMTVVVLRPGGAAVSNLRMQRSASIEGRVINTTGSPVADLIVTADRVRQTPDGPATIDTRWERTDDLGRFRLHTLAPGTFRLRVSAPSGTSGPELFFPGTPNPEQAALIPIVGGDVTGPLDFIVEAPPTAGHTRPARQAIEGRVVDEFGDPMPGVSMQLMVRRTIGGQPRLVPAGAPGSIFTGWTDDRGAFRVAGLPPGDYYLLARTGLFGESKEWLSSLRLDAPVGFAPTFYPGTPDLAAAAPIQLVAGADAIGIEFPLVQTTINTLVGTVVDPDGRPVPGAEVVIGGTSNLLSTTTMTGDDGAFRVRGLSEGTFVVRAQREALIGSLTVTVPPVTRPQSVEATVGIRPLTRAEGHVRFDGEGARPASVSVLVRPSGLDAGFPAGIAVPGDVDANGRFETRQFVQTGMIRTAAAGWALKSVTLNGQDITDLPYDFQTADVTGLEVTMTNRLGSVEGTVVDGDARPPEANVIVFPPDPAQWGFASRLVSVGRPLQHGGFTMRDLLPGQYLVVAVAGATMSPLDVDPEWLERLRPFATPLRIVEGANAPVALGLVKF